MTRESIDVEGRAARGRTAVARPAWTLRATVGLLAVLMSNMLVTAAPSVSAAVVTSTTRVAVTVTGGQPTARTTEPDISDDGRFVAFSSAATNLVAGDTNAKSDVFVRDLQANTTTRVSVGTSGVQGNGNSENPALSSDGRYVAFETFSTNLTTPATSGNRTVMIHDRTTGTTELVAISNGQAMGGIIGAASVSDDGRMVAFSVSSMTTSHLYLRDRQAGTTTLLTSGANNYSGSPRLSADGRHLVFMSAASNLVTGDTNGRNDVFVRHLDSGVVRRLSVTSTGAQATGGDAWVPSVSDDATLVTFRSDATNLVPGDTNASADIFVHDLLNGVTERVSVSSAGAQTDGSPDNPAISGDGRFVTFKASGNTLVPGFGGGGHVAVYVRDRAEQTTTAVSVTTSGTTPTRYIGAPFLSEHGRHIVYESEATNLVVGDTNEVADIFLASVDIGRFYDASEPELRGRRPSGGYAEDPVNTATGNYTETVVDLDFPASTAGLEWSRTYNSRSSEVGGLGRGWTHAYGDRVTEDALGNVSLREADGRVVRFPRSTGGFGRPPELRASLSKAVDGTFTLAWDDGRTDRFDAGGRLTSRSFVDGQAVTLAWAGAELSSASAGTGRSLAFGWSGGRLSTATAGDGRAASYAYDADGDLASVTVTDGGTTVYTTDASGRVTAVTDPDGRSVVANTYDTAGRVVSQTMPSGATVTFAYDDATGRTTLGRVGSSPTVVYAHDPRGRLASVTDPHGKVLAKTWDTAGNLAAVVDRRGAGVTQGFDAKGNVVSRTEPEGVASAFAYDAANRVTSATNGAAEATTLSYQGAEPVPTTVTDAQGGVTTYDVVGSLVESVTDADGVTLDLTWNAKRELVGVTDENARTTSYAYDAAGNRTSTTTPLGFVTTTTWDGRRRVTSTTDGAGATQAWSWSAAGKLLSHTDAASHTTTFGYDGAGRITSSTDALGKVTTYGYDADGNRTSMTRPGGATSTSAYDPLGRLLSETDPTGVTTTYGYDADGNPTSVVDEHGKAETRAYDLRGRVTARTDRLGKTITYVYDAADRIVSETDPLGGVTAYAYDDAGRVVSRTAPDGGVWARTWTPAGRLDTETDPRGHTTDLVYDPVGRLDAVVDPLGHVTDHTWDADGRLVSRTTPEGLVAAHGYDAVGRIVSTTTPAGGVTTTTWTPTGEVATESRPASGTRSFAYDALGRMTTATDANGRATTWSYDDRGNALTRTDARGGVASWTWDAADRLLASTDPLGRTSTRAYDDLGRLATVADPSGRTIATAYDDAWRVSSLTYGNGTTTSYGYDALGRRTSLVDGTGTTTFAWDPVGRMTSVAYPGGRSLAFEWDDAGNRTKLVYPDGTAATFTWDAGNRLSGIVHPHAAAGVAYTYDDDGRLLTETLPGSVTRSRTWQSGRVVAYVEARPEGTRSTTLVRDLADRVTSETTNGSTTDYGYDPAGQITTVTRGSETTAYAYDEVGNRTSKQRGMAATTYAYDAAQQLTSATRTTNGLPVESLTVAHDGAGRLTSLTGATANRTLSYDARGVLASVATSRLGVGVSTTERSSDGDAVLRRATTTTPMGTHVTDLVWDPTSSVPEVATTATGGADVNHLYGMGRALALRGGQPDAYAHDARGSALAIGEAADLAEAADYDEFGVPTTGAPADLFDEVAGAAGGPMPTFGYRGEAHLDAMVHLRARDYAPGTGRFTTTDPLDGVAGEVTVANPYPYAANDPLNMVDPLGLRPLSDADLAVKIGFAGVLASTDPWLAAFMKRLFSLYNENHAEAVGLAVQQIVAKYQPTKLSVEAYVNGVYPDIVATVKGQVYFWEVKPNSEYGRRTGIAQLANYEVALAGVGGLPGPKIGSVRTPMSSTGGLYVHDAPTDGLIFYEKDQRKLREEALEHANKKVPEFAVPIVVLVPVPVPVPLPG